VAAGFPQATLPAAIALTVGIGIQNCPEGFAVSVPLRREGMTRLGFLVMMILDVALS
jgi:zinc transporter, ZIP family